MNTVIQKVIEMSLYGSIAILLVILFRMVFRKYSKKLTLLFWVIVAVRLLCPFNFSSSLSLMNLVPSRTQTENHQTVQEEEATKIPVIVRTAKSIPDNASKAEERPAVSIDPKSILFVLWAGGTAVLLSYAGVRYFKVRRFVSGCRKSSDNLYLESDKTDTPFVAGVFKPRICIPSHLENNEREYLLLHEQTHIKNHDGIIKTFGFLVVCIHWFNPLVWLSYVMLCSDLEMRCDEEVIEQLGTGIKKDYCRSIIMHSVREPAALPGNTAFSGFGLGALEVKMRINNILKHKKVSKSVSVLILCVAIGLTAVLTACKKENIVETSVSEATTTSSSEEDAQTEATTNTTTSAAVQETTEDTIQSTEETGVIDTSFQATVPDERISSVIDELEEDGYDCVGMLLNTDTNEYGDLMIVSKDDTYYNVTVSEDGSYEITENDSLELHGLTIEDAEDWEAKLDIQKTDQSTVLVYSVQLEGDDVDVESIEEMFEDGILIFEFNNKEG